MSTKLTSKVIASVLVGIVVGVGLYLHTKERRRAGRDAFMAQQAERWDRSYSRPLSVVPAIIAGLGLSVMVFGVYELLASCVCFFLRKQSSGSASS